MEEIVYFELNNWFPDRDYPDDEPFKSWLGDDLNQKFQDKAWLKKNRLCVFFQILDMSFNYLITAPKIWVEKNCPNLLTRHKRFLRFPKDGEDLPIGRTGEYFLPYKPENIGVTEGEWV